MYIDCHSHQTGQKTLELLRIESLRLEQLANPLPTAYSIGLHPCYLIDMTNEAIRSLSEHVETYRPIAIGEAGIDKLSHAPLSDQISALNAQIELSEHYKLPIIIHCVRGWNELKDLRRRHKPQMPWIIHGFRKQPLLAQELLNLGYHLSFGYYAHLGSLKLAFEHERLLLETDTHTERSIQYLYRHTAKVLHTDITKLSQSIEQTASNLFFNR